MCEFRFGRKQLEKETEIVEKAPGHSGSGVCRAVSVCQCIGDGMHAMANTSDRGMRIAAHTYFMIII